MLIFDDRFLDEDIISLLSLEIAEGNNNLFLYCFILDVFFLLGELVLLKKL